MEQLKKSTLYIRVIFNFFQNVITTREENLSYGIKITYGKLDCPTKVSLVRTLQSNYEKRQKHFT
uniref:Uncharacterized protein n=1 Tax=Lepeophtheirus salmonis TaxID=72036 RepID=A0A0K2T000_LEPSM